MWYYKRSNPKWIIWLTSASIVMLLLWMNYSTIQMVVRSEGKVVPSGQNKVVQHLEGGIISEILVNEGDTVRQGQPLFRIKNEFVRADLRELAISKQALEARSYRLKSLLANHQTIQFSTEFEAADAIKNAEQHLFRDALNDFNKELQVLSNIYQRRQNKVTELVSQRENLKQELNLAMQDLKINQQLLAKGAASEKEVLDSQKRFQAIKTNFDRVDLSIPTARSEEREALSKLEKSRANFQLQQRQELNEVELSIQKINAKIDARVDVQQRSEVVSSVNGMINKLLINTIGGIVQPGESLASITPIDDSLIIEAKVKEADRGEIWLGQKARVKFRAYDFSRFGSLEGKITFISPDSTPDQRFPNKYFYRVNISVSKQALADDKPILPGMLTDVDLLAESKSVLAIILGPIVKSWGRALTEQ